MEESVLPIKGYPKKWACENLKELIQENFKDEELANTTYSAYAAMAHELSRDDIADTLKQMAADESQHRKNLEEIYDILLKVCSNL